MFNTINNHWKLKKNFGKYIDKLKVKFNNINRLN